MRHSPEERLAVGCRVYHQELSLTEAVYNYDSHHSTISNWVKDYRERYNLPESCPDEYKYLAGVNAVQAKYSQELLCSDKETLIEEIISLRERISQFQNKNKQEKE